MTRPTNARDFTVAGFSLFVVLVGRLASRCNRWAKTKEEQLLLESIDQTRLEVSPTLDPKRRSKPGQFMTPSRIASFMGGMFDVPPEVRLLDAGAGMGALTAAFVAQALARDARPKLIDVTCYEVDDKLASILDGTLAACAEQCAASGIKFTS